MPIFRLLYSRSYFPYISLALFLAVLPLYFVGYIHSSTTIIFCTLYSRRSVAVIFCTLYPWLCEVLVKQLTRKASRELSQKCLACLTHLPCKILLGGISLMSTKFLLYLHKKEILKWGRLYEKFKNKILSVT